MRGGKTMQRMIVGAVSVDDDDEYHGVCDFLADCWLVTAATKSEGL